MVSHHVGAHRLGLRPAGWPRGRTRPRSRTRRPRRPGPPARARRRRRSAPRPARRWCSATGPAAACRRPPGWPRTLLGKTRTCSSVVVRRRPWRSSWPSAPRPPTASATSAAAWRRERARPPPCCCGPTSSAWSLMLGATRRRLRRADRRATCGIGALGGLAGAAGVGLLYQGLAIGPMSAVAPVDRAPGGGGAGGVGPRTG